ncbi:hypothetical protein WJX84_002244 [Apatococcus fuscideae]|uniref:Uncharacterized protein n=1 Tax=Apatococcus fuscideae TaxID=2026836 RepID=A0AAW1T1Z9_9CHLO
MLLLWKRLQQHHRVAEAARPFGPGTTSALQAQKTSRKKVLEHNEEHLLSNRCITSDGSHCAKISELFSWGEPRINGEPCAFLANFTRSSQSCGTLTGITLGAPLRAIVRCLGGVRPAAGSVMRLTSDPRSSAPMPPRYLPQCAEQSGEHFLQSPYSCREEMKGCRYQHAGIMLLLCLWGTEDQVPGQIALCHICADTPLPSVEDMPHARACRVLRNPMAGVQTLDLLEAAELVNRAPRSVLTESDRYILTLDIISRLRNFLQQQLDGFSAGAGVQGAQSATTASSSCGSHQHPRLTG